MNDLVRSELFKLRSTKLAGILMGVWLVISCVIAGAIAGFTDLDDLSTIADQSEALRFSWSLLGLLLMPVVGVAIATSDTNHRTLGMTLLNEPDRRRIVVAKALTALQTGAGAGVLTGFLTIVVATIVFSARGGPTDLITEQGLWFVAAATIFGALVTLFGFGVGLLINNQTAAVVITIAFFIVIENILTLVLVLASAGDVVAWLPGATSGQTALLGAAGVEADPGFDEISLLSRPVSTAVLAGWGLVLTALGAYRLERSDVT